MMRMMYELSGSFCVDGVAQHPPLASLRSLAPSYAGTKGASNLNPLLFPLGHQGGAKIPLPFGHQEGGVSSWISREGRVVLGFGDGS